MAMERTLVHTLLLLYGPPAQGRTIFIDVGANCGNSYMALLSRKLNLPNFRNLGKERDYLPNSSGTDVVAYLWEANPRWLDAKSRQRAENSGA